jgi:hypothetical protein
MRMIVHSATIQDRGGARGGARQDTQRFPWLELVWAVGCYNAR